MSKKTKYRSEWSEEFEQHLDTVDHATSFAKELRCAADYATRREFEFLLMLEERPTLWGKMAATFAEYLTKNNLRRPATYENWKIGRRMIPVAIQDEIGFDATRHLPKCPPASRADCIRRFRETAQREKVPLSNQRAKTILQEYLPRDPRPGAESAAQLKREIARLRRENERLRKLLKTAEAKLKKLREDVGKLRKKTKRERPAAGMPSTQHVQ